MEHCNSSAEDKVLDDLLWYTDAEHVYKWTYTLLKIHKIRMAKRTLHPQLEHSLSEVNDSK